MKRTKKLLALVLAMMMAFSIMAVTAAAYDKEDAHEHTAAYGDEGIMPIPVELTCKCGQMSRETMKDEAGRIYERFACYNCQMFTAWVRIS